MKLQDKVAIVTGAASGYGKSDSNAFSLRRGKVLAVDLNFDGVEAVVKEIKANDGTAQVLAVNVSKREDVENMIDTAVETYVTLDILVNNAGIIDRMEPVGDVEDDNWARILAVNMKDVMMAMRKTMPTLLEKEAGVIINTASTGGLNGVHAGATYTASKHAVVGLMKNTAFMYGDQGIRCNAIAPEAIETNIMADATDVNELFDAGRTGRTHSAVPRAGQSEEIADVALFVASDESRFVNGHVLVADAGWTAAF